MLTYNHLDIFLAVVCTDPEFKSPQLQSVLIILSMILKKCYYYYCYCYYYYYYYYYC
jgi:hypothetical protein